MLLASPRKQLQEVNLPIPQPNENQLLIRVEACGICRTDLHIYEGELSNPNFPLILGHQIVGTIVERGINCHSFSTGTRIGVPWLGKSCSVCSYCQEGRENLCDRSLYTGYDLNGGFAEYCLANEDFVFPIPDQYPPIHAAPLLCAGLIGYRALKMIGNAKKIGFFGFGSAAHILIQIANFQGMEICAFTRPGDTDAQTFAKSLGAVWAGDSNQESPWQLDAAIIFASNGELIPLALKAIKKGGKVVCAGIHMSDIPSFAYALIYGEKVLCSVTNLTREDGKEFFEIAKQHELKTSVTTYPLEQANQALMDLKAGKVTGSLVLKLNQ